MCQIVITIFYRDRCQIPAPVVIEFSVRKLLGDEIYAEVVKAVPANAITEIRLRRGERIFVKHAAGGRFAGRVCSSEDISAVLKRATMSSLYAYQEELKNGYVHYTGGIRIGVAGEGVVESGKVITYKNFSSLVIRIPHEIVGAANPVVNLLNPFENIIVISPPYGGKTTLLRDIARIVSENADTLVLDERGEFFAGGARFGPRADFILNTPKRLAAEGAVRALNPEIIVMDEIFPPVDMPIVREIASSGIKIAASLHSDSVESALKRFPELKELFSYAVVLTHIPRAGSIKSVTRL